VASSSVDFDRLAHQLRNPVTVIRTLARLVRNRLDEDDPNRLLLEAIDRECRRIDGLLDGEGECAPLDLAAFVAELLPGAEALARQRGVELTVATEPLAVVTDGHLLREVVMGLLENAFKYTPPGGSVHLSSQREGGWAVLRVTDTGPGIDPADLEHIFEPYYRGSRTGSLPGRGLGLAIVRELVERLGGQIEATSIADTPGSWFTVRLPLGREP